MAEVRDKIIIYNTDLENKVNSVSLETGELALVREKDKERLFIKNTAGVVVPIHNILDAGEIIIPLPTIQEAWIDSGLASWSGNTSLKNQVKFDYRHSFLQGDFTPPLVSDMDRLTSMNWMFSDCSRLTSLDVSNFNTSKVTDMSWMFMNCTGLTSLDLSNFDTNNVTDMSWMFQGCTGLTSLDLSNFDTSNVIDMNMMFSGCTSLTSDKDIIGLSNFNTSNVTGMTGMFSDCSGLKSLNVSGWNIRHMTSMSHMFSGCTGLTSLDLSNWNTSNVTNMNSIFSGCTSLVTIKCTEATQTKILSFSDTSLPTNFNGWIIVEPTP